MDLSKVKFGWNKDKDDFRDLKYKLDKTIILPETDLRAKAQPIYDQDGVGCCTGEGSNGIFEYVLRQQGLTDFVPSALFTYYNARAYEGDTGEDAGAQIRDAIKGINKYGVCHEKLWPLIQSKVTKKPSKKCYNDAIVNISLSYESVPTITAIKQVLSKGYPVVFGAILYESFMSDQVAKTGFVPMPKKGEDEAGGHCMAIFGHSDSKKWFIVRNSWGESWGLHGYCLIPYDYFTSKLTSDFWVIYTVK